MGSHTYTLTIRLPHGLAEELEQLARETGRSESYVSRRALIEFLEVRVDYRRAVAVLEPGKDQPNPTLDEARPELGLDG